jgi:hypothetical protein
MGRGKRRLQGHPSGFVARERKPHVRIPLGDSGPRTRQIVPTKLTESLIAEAESYRIPEGGPLGEPRARALAGRSVVVTGGIPGYQNREDVLRAVQTSGALAYDDAKDINSQTIVFVSKIQKDKLEKFQANTLPMAKLSKKVQAALNRGATVIKVNTQADFDNVLNGRLTV